jgi:hypothetical protein
MERNEGRKHTGKLVGGVIAVLLVASAGLFTAVSAQGGPTSGCSGESVTEFGTDFFGPGRTDVAVFSTGTTSRTFNLVAPLSAGEYALSAVSYDGYPDRDLVTAQPYERWFAELLSADGSVLAQSGTTQDIQDGVLEDTWAGAIGIVTIADTATQVRIVHAFQGGPNPNSVEPVCVAATEILPEPEPEAPTSSVTVTFQDEGPDASTISLDCGGTSESANGRLVQLRLAELPGGSSCAIDYPADRVCDITSTPAGTDLSQVRDQLVVSIPSEGSVDIQVNIICRVTPVDPGEPVVTTTTVAPQTPTTTAAPVSPTTTVAAIVPEVESATATPQQANPAFTG